MLLTFQLVELGTMQIHKTSFLQKRKRELDKTGTLLRSSVNVEPKAISPESDKAVRRERSRRKLVQNESLAGCEQSQRKTPEIRKTKRSCSPGEGVVRSPPENYALFVGQVPFDCTVHQLETAFKKQGVKDITITLKKRRTGRGTAFGFCSTKSDFDLALSMNNADFQGRKLVVEVAKSDRSSAASDTRPAKYRAHRVFIGQLPFRAKVEDIEKHLESLGVGKLKIRLLTDKKTGKSRGIAFADCQDEKQLVRALRAHHSRLLGKIINIERTVGGGGRGEKRKGKLQLLRQRQGAKVLKDTKRLVNQIISRTIPCQVKAEELDDRTIQALGTFPTQVVEAVLKEFVSLDFSEVKNKSAYLMGTIKRYRTKLEDGTDFIPETATWKSMRPYSRRRRS